MSTGIVYQYFIKFKDKTGNYSGKYYSSRTLWGGVTRDKAERMNFKTARYISNIFNSEEFKAKNKDRCPVGTVILKEPVSVPENGSESDSE